MTLDAVIGGETVSWEDHNLNLVVYFKTYVEQRIAVGSSHALQLGRQRVELLGNVAACYPAIWATPCSAGIQVRLFQRIKYSTLPELTLSRKHS
jgi:hypothetical protein